MLRPRMAQRLEDQLEDQLDAALDGAIPGAARAELGPLLRAADELRTALARIELDPAAARRHLAQPLASPTTPAGPRARSAGRARPATRRRRRRAAVLALAAGLVLAPLVALSADELPGEPLYLVKLTVENARLHAARWSPSRSALERIRSARARLSELHRLVSAGRIDRIPTAISALDGAVATTQLAVGAVAGPLRPAGASALDDGLRELRADRTAELTSLPRRLPSSTPVAARVKIEGAVELSLSQGQAGTSR
jgi:anti-sigma factor RsiW